MTMAIQNYQSLMGDAASKRFGTFSYLPELDANEIRKQVTYLIGKGWQCAVEHIEPQRATVDYWYMWKLPLFGESNVDTIMNELTACRNANPGHHIRLVAYDSDRQTQGQSMVVLRGDV